MVTKKENEKMAEILELELVSPLKTGGMGYSGFIKKRRSFIPSLHAVTIVIVVVRICLPQ
jgi:hypothetical protein